MTTETPISTLYIENFELTCTNGRALLYVNSLIKGDKANLEEEPGEVIWVRENGQLVGKYTASVVAELIQKAKNNTPADTKPLAFFEVSNGRLYLIVNNRRFNALYNLRMALSAVIDAYGLEKWLLNKMFSNKEAKAVEAASD